MTDSVNKGPLAGVKVLELAQIMAGPTCGTLLADMGADVIKVEKLPGGDDTRRYAEPQINGESAAFMVMNRNKRSIAVNLKTDGGKEVVKRMVAGADVLTENYRRGALDKLGIGYEALRAINPALIYCSISGYGRSGPYADKGGFDLIAQGVSGLMSITGEPGGPPVKSGSPIADINAGILAALGIVSAYVHRLKTGEGQLVDTSLMEAGIHQTFWQSAIYFATGVSAGPSGSAHILTAPYQAFPTKDGWINIGGANQSNWERIAQLVGAPELIADTRFVTNTARMANLSALTGILGELLKRRGTREWLHDFDAAGIPAGPINSIADMVNDPQTLAREMVVELDHPKAGHMRALGLPIKFSETPGSVRRPAPMLGEHSREILREYAWSDAEIEALAGEGAVLLGK
ncbi:MAG: CoA transferase [Methylibium sp.]|uniref:CaiB/BaiF CoA transferase family protein n=1 Tax=Methylibium sp. TaxID=2067992 RepID=UPI0018092849|nr:CoA transferase [Methylibium sp.]MBA3597331.1 CoA transferase [Methylibium sp.]